MATARVERPAFGAVLEAEAGRLSWSPVITTYRNVSVLTEKKKREGADVTQPESSFCDVCVGLSQWV